MSEIRVKSTGTIKLFESDNTSHVTIASPASLSANRTITIPDADVTLGAGTTINNNADNRVITGSGTANTLEGEANLTFGSNILHTKQGASGATATTDANNLVVEGNGITGISLLTTNSNDCSITFGDQDDNDVGFINYAHGSNSMMFKTNTSERMRILSDGTITMSTTGSIPSNQGGLHVVRGDGQNGTIGHFQSDSSANYDANIINTVCSNTSTDATYNFYRAQSNVFKYAVRDSGNVVNVNNSYGASSDERIKQDITDANSQWEDIKALKIRNFKLKSDTTKTHIGVVAQELETANMNGLVEDAKPEKEDVAYHSDFGTIVSGTADNGATPIKNDDGKITGYEDVFTEGQKVKAVKYSVLYMKAIKCLQEAITKIETLETANTNKDTTIADLTTRLEALENA